MKAKSWFSPRAAGLAAVCALVLGIYGYAARSGGMDLLRPGPADCYYNLLVRGFRAGQLSLPKAVPPGLAHLVDPYNPAANAAYRAPPGGGVHDLSYYRGKLYLYFGPAPALILFWPFAALTGRYLWHRQAAALFCAAGFLTGVGLLGALRRRYFPEAGGGVMAAVALAFGLATGLLVLLARAEVYEVAIACGYLLTLLALAAIWRALHRPEHGGRWLAAASAAYGLAVAARPSLLPGAACLLVPLFWGRGRWFRRSLCALGPIAGIGLGLMLYNYARFGQALEFGQHYQLASDRQDGMRHFSLHYLWFNFRVYFLAPTRWTRHFPFVQRTAAPRLPAGHAPIEDPFGILTNIPVLWLALAAPWAWRNRARETGALRGFILAVAVLFGASALTLGLFYGSCSRYEEEFLPELALLALVGIFAVERMLAARPAWRWLARCGWGALLAWSLMFNLLASISRYADARDDYGVALANEGRTDQAIQVYTDALRLKPDAPDMRNNLGNALVQSGRLPEAIGQFVAALRLEPNDVDVRVNLGHALVQSGRLDEAVGQYRQILRLKPNDAGVNSSLGSALMALGRLPEAITTLANAVRLNRSDAETRNRLGLALARSGRLSEAILQFEESVRLKPDVAGVHYNLALALRNAGRTKEAEFHFERAAQLQRGP